MESHDTKRKIIKLLNEINPKYTLALDIQSEHLLDFINNKENKIKEEILQAELQLKTLKEKVIQEKRFLREQELEKRLMKTILDPEPAKVDHVSNCRICHKVLSSKFESTCPICGELICNSCKSCKCQDLDKIDYKSSELSRYEEAIKDETDILNDLKNKKSKFIKIKYYIKNVL